MVTKSGDMSYGELVKIKGLEAAKGQLDLRRNDLVSRKQTLEYQLQQVNNELLALEGQFRQQVRDAMRELDLGDLVEARPAAHAAPQASGRGVRRSAEQIDEDRQAILATLPTSENKAIAIGTIADAVGRDITEMRSDFIRLRNEGEIQAVGSGRNTRYYRG